MKRCRCISPYNGLQLIKMHAVKYALSHTIVKCHLIADNCLVSFLFYFHLDAVIREMPVAQLTNNKWSGALSSLWRIVKKKIERKKRQQQIDRKVQTGRKSRSHVNELTNAGIDMSMHRTEQHKQQQKQHQQIYICCLFATRVALTHSNCNCRRFEIKRKEWDRVKKTAVAVVAASANN